MKHPLPILVFLLCIPALSYAQENRDDAIFGEDFVESTPTGPTEEEDPLEIGGQLYLRSNLSVARSEELKDQRLALPGLADLYLDSRPNDRLRAFVRGRLQWDPTVSDESTTTLTGPTAQRTNVLLDEVWMKFDAGRTVFFTVGQAHVRWGTTRVWNPVDVIHRQRRDPLALFDERVGIPQIKLHIPIESLGWNFYLLGLTEEMSTLNRASVAGRGEFVFSTVELGLTGAHGSGRDPKAGLDLSAGMGDFDLTAEAGTAFVSKKDVALEVSAGLQYGIPIFDEDTLYVGIEGFYNPEGADSIEDALYDTIYRDTGFTKEEVTSLLASADKLNPDAIPQEDADKIASDGMTQALEPFYLGKYYGAFLISMPGPGTWDDVSFTLTTLSNLSDKSAVSRLDVSIVALTHLRIETYVAGHYGNEGELRFGPGALGTLEGATDFLGELPPTQFLQLGLNLRMDL